MTSPSPVATIGNLGNQFPTILSLGENVYGPENPPIQQHFSHPERRPIGSENVLISLTTHRLDNPPLQFKLERKHFLQEASSSLVQ
jgi:hypothetical protein